MSIRLDRSKCSGHAMCHAVDENLFPLDEQGYSIVEPHTIAVADEKLAWEGVQACPEGALTLEQD